MRTVAATLFTLLFLTKAFGQTADSSLKIAHLTGDFYVYTTYNLYKGNRIGANALYLVTNKGVVLLDSPWDTTQFQPLLDSIEARHQQKVVLCLATHFHEDRTGGLAYYRQKGIKTFTTRKTDEWSRVRGMKRAEFLMEQDTVFRVGQYSFETYYPGPGHAPDNLVVWFSQQKVLFGGCLVKSVEDRSLGNLSDADTKAYAATIKRVIRKFRKPNYIITGHNDYTSTRSLRHTLKMARQLKGKH